MTPRAKVRLVVLGGLLGYSLSVWFVVSLLGISASDLWKLRLGLWILGALGAGAVLWFLRKPAPSEPAAAGEEIDPLLSSARTHLAAARITRRASFDSLPLVLLVGPSGSAKTTLVMQSGMDSELLAGEGARDMQIAPTPSVNVWYGGGVVFLEAGGKLLAEPTRWTRLLRHLQPRPFRRALSGGAKAGRIVLVCFGCDELLKSEAAAVAAARQLRERLAAISQQLGTRIPVYVLFSKADQLPFFAEFVRNFSSDEAQEVLGATLPMDIPSSAGSFADRESQRLKAAFQQLCLSLAERRLEILAREHETEIAGRAYEFPRELRKLAGQAVAFMVELCRPSQLQVSPFLRGFYFTGVRAVLAEEALPTTAARAVGTAYARSTAATGLFHSDDVFGVGPVAAAAYPGPAAREYPQWLFVQRLFSDVILRDDAAMAVTQGGVRVNLPRRLLLGTATALCLLLGLGFTVSFFGNETLAERVAQASRAVAGLPTAAAVLPSRESLRLLDTLRNEVETLGRYQRTAPPWRLRFGLYTGGEIFPRSRRTYFEGLGKQLFGTAHSVLLDSLRKLPDSSRGSDQYGSVYRRLKAHLITTSYPDSSTPQFLAPVLMSHWQSSRRLDAERTELARRQFEFYSRELPFGNPYALKEDSAAVARARAFLARYSSAERVYQSMVADGARRAQPVRFDRLFPQSAAYLRDPYEVPAAFTRPGWAAMMNALSHADRYLEGENWVLGEDDAPPVDREQVVQELRSRYERDYIGHWRAFVDSASVAPYTGLKDAAQKLAVFGGNGSPLLRLIEVASHHTNLAQPAVQKAFRALHVIAPDSAGKTGDTASKAQSAASGYVNALDGLQVALERVLAAPVGGNDAAVDKALESADLAKLEIKKVARGFGPEGEEGPGKAVQRLMSDPITGAEGLLRNLGPAQMNAAGGAFCAPLRQLASKFPFSRRAAMPANPLDVAKIFQPGSGTLWTLYNDALQKVLVRKGSEYTAADAGEVTVTPEFVRFFNRAAAVSEAFYQGGDPEPRLTFRLTPILSEAIPSATLAFEGQTARFNRNAPETKQFVGLAAAGRTAKLSAQFGQGEGVELTLEEYHDPWAIFRLFSAADRWQPAGDGYIVEWTLRSGRADGRSVTAGGAAANVAFRLDLGGAPPLLKPGFFDGLGCSGIVVQ
jgi:type VI secretion system protein ImpL